MDFSATVYRKTGQPLAPGEAEALRPNHDGYRLWPTHRLPEGEILRGMDALAGYLVQHRRIALDGVAAVLWTSIEKGLGAALSKRGASYAWFNSRDAFASPDVLDAMLAPYLGDDPLFGRRFEGTIDDFLDQGRLRDLKARVAEQQGPLIVVGPGAASVLPDGYLVFFDVPKNEAQYRSRAHSIANLGAERPVAASAAYKRNYFVDWPVQRRMLASLLPDIGCIVDAQRPADPSFCEGDTLRRTLRHLAQRPFRVRPWFEPGAWGGTWLKRRIPDLPQNEVNYAWSFELITPENGILVEANGAVMELSFDLLMAQESERVLAGHVRRFGQDFPIRFDFLDTFDGGSLSLQCHPRTEYIEREFGEPFTQDETYYILDAKPGAQVYLGFRERADHGAFERALRESAELHVPVDVDEFVQSHPARPHDLFLIPHGTVHCAGEGTLVLEISATPYIFTFKLYDWLRVGLDGKPRTLNIDRALANLDTSRRGEAVTRDLVPVARTIARGDGWVIEHLPTAPEHFYDIHRLVIDDELSIATDGSCHILSLVEGARMCIDAGDGPQPYRYAETVVVPAATERYTVRAVGETSIKVLKAFLKDDRD